MVSLDNILMHVFQKNLKTSYLTAIHYFQYFVFFKAYDGLQVNLILTFNTLILDAMKGS